LLFPTHNRSGQLIPGRRLTPGAIARVCQRRAAEAGLAATAAHDLRRTSITELLESGADLATASRHAGHANPQTTMRYDRRPRRRQRDAIAKLHFPWF
jgi:integrase